MLGIVVRRLLQGLLVVLASASVTFLLIHLAPGDPITASLDAPAISEEVRAQWRRVYGLDRPLAEQYVRWLANALRGDFGWSISDGRPVRAVLADALPNTILLVGTALAAGFLAGIAAGVFQAAMRARSTRAGRRIVRCRP